MFVTYLMMSITKFLDIVFLDSMYIPRLSLHNHFQVAPYCSELDNAKPRSNALAFVTRRLIG